MATTLTLACFQVFPGGIVKMSADYGGDTLYIQLTRSELPDNLRLGAVVRDVVAADLKNDDKEASQSLGHACSAILQDAVEQYYLKSSWKTSALPKTLEHFSDRSDRFRCIRYREQRPDGRLYELVKEEQEIMPMRKGEKEAPGGEISTFFWDDIQVHERLRRDVLRICIDGKDYCCKTIGHNKDREVSRELDLLIKYSPRANPKIRVPRLKGIVRRNADSHIQPDLRNRIVGVVEEYIKPWKTDKPTLSDLAAEGLKEYSTSRREKWVEQVARYVRFLHDNGMAWGGGNADHVLVDVEKSAWLVSFGRSRRRRDLGYARAFDSDHQAVRDIGAALKVEEGFVEAELAKEMAG